MVFESEYHPWNILYMSPPWLSCKNLHDYKMATEVVECGFLLCWSSRCPEVWNPHMAIHIHLAGGFWVLGCGSTLRTSALQHFEIWCLTYEHCLFRMASLNNFLLQMRTSVWRKPVLFVKTVSLLHFQEALVHTIISNCLDRLHKAIKKLNSYYLCQIYI